MKRKTLLWLCAPACLPVGATLNADRPLMAQGAAAIVMVVNKANGIGPISKADAKKLVLGQTATWPGGGKVTLVMRPEQSAERVSVLQKVCGMSEADYTRYEMQVMFTGRAAAVLQAEPSSAAVKSFVKANPGAVGFVHPGDVDSDIKAVLTIE